MKLLLPKFYQFLSEPLALRSRPLLLLLVIPLVLSFASPLWKISMEAPQYPKGLYLEIYAYKLDGGNDGQHVAEINTLNHYIGMRPLDKAASADLDWIPFALGLLGLLALRVALIGTVRDLIDLVTLTTYISAFAFARYVYRLYIFGHALSPDAPLKIEPFMPVIIGTKQIANFTTHSFPQSGSYFLAVFVLGIWAVLLVHLYAGRRRAFGGPLNN